MADVKEIVKAHLIANGFDGISCEYCHCNVDDLMPCAGMDYSLGDVSGCEPGYKIPCDPETCSADGDCEWHIGPKTD